MRGLFLAIGLACLALLPAAAADKADKGDKEANKRFRELGLNRLLLHASHLSFELDGRSYGFSAPLPDDLKDVLDRLAAKR